MKIQGVEYHWSQLPLLAAAWCLMWAWRILSFNWKGKP